MKESWILQIRYVIKQIPYALEIYDFFHIFFTPGYAEDGMRVHKNAGFLKKQAYRDAYDAGLVQDPGRKTRWRTHTLLWAGMHASKLDGDFVECGVEKACFSRSVMEYVQFHKLADKKFYLIDTYNGLVEGQVGKDEKAAYVNEYKDTYDFVRRSFINTPNVIVVKGVVPQVLPTLQITKVAYLSIDMNCVLPEREALEFFWPKIVPGGIIVLDDYAFPGRNPQQVSSDEFARMVGVEVLTLPTGQGVIIKPANSK